MGKFYSYQIHFMKHSFRSGVAHLASQPKLLALAAVIAVGANLTAGLPALQGQTTFLGIGTNGNTGTSNGTTTTQGQTGVSPSGTTAGTQGNNGNTGTSNGGTTTTQGQTGTSNGTTTAGTSNGMLALSNPIVVDDGGTGYTAPVAVRTVGFSGDSRTIVPNVWAFNSVTPGTFDVYVTWIAAPTNSTATSYSLFTKVGTGRTLVGTFTVDQTQAPADATHTGNSLWKKLTRVTVTTGQKLELTGAIERNAYIDAVALQRIPFADLTLEKTAPATVAPGATLTYTLKIGNTGTDTATSVRLSNPLSAGIDFSGASGATCVASGSNVVCSGLTINAAQSKTVTLRYIVSPESICDSTINSGAAAVTTAVQEVSTANNQSAAVNTSVLCAAGDVTVTMTGPATVTRGQTLIYTVTVTNQGPTAVTTSVTDRIPLQGITFLAAPQSSAGCSVSGRDVTCSGISLGARGSTTSSIIRTIILNVPATFTCPTPPTISNIARVSTSNDPNRGNNETDPVGTTCQ